MYRFVDQRCEQIVAGSRFLLSAMRGWVIFARQGRCPAAGLGPLFAEMEMSDILGEFHAWMLHLHRDARLNLMFGCHCQTDIQEDEALMLALWSDVAFERPSDARGLLQLLVHERSVDEMIARMCRISSHMALHGLAPQGLCSESNSAAVRFRSSQ